MKTVLITGGLGFIGSNLSLLLREEYSVTILDNKTNNKFDSVYGCDLIVGDIRTFVFDKPYDYVLNLAAITTIEPKFNGELFSVNCAGFENIYRQTTGQFLYASSCAAINKMNDYGKTKAHNEHIAKDGMGFRFYNVYGKNDNGVVGKFLKPNPVMYGGDQIRDFIYVKDLVMVIKENLDSKGILEIGTGIGTKIKDLATIMGITPEVKEFNSFEEKENVCTSPINYKYSIVDGIEDMKK